VVDDNQHMRKMIRTLLVDCCVRVRKMQALVRVECQIYDSTNPLQQRTFFASPTKSAGVGG
jgi:hypothetical protein